MLALLAAALIGTYQGHDVLITGTAPMAASLTATAEPGGVTHLDLAMSSGGTTLTAYDLNMTKRLHLIFVSDDLRTFRHLHPVLHPDGRFTLDVAPAPPGLYHIYIDGDPHGFGRQVFRFDVPIGGGVAAPARVLHRAGTVSKVGPYEVRLDTTQVAAGRITTLHVTILKNGIPATDLHPYLGGMAHGVFIGTTDLAYMHTHGMSAQMLAASDAADCGDSMMASMPPLPANATIPNAFVIQVLAPRPETYNLWLQFTGGPTLYTAPFQITAT